MEESYIVRVYRRERVKSLRVEQPVEERISGVVEDVKRELRKPFHSAEELWQLITGNNDAV